MSDIPAFQGFFNDANTVVFRSGSLESLQAAIEEISVEMPGYIAARRRMKPQRYGNAMSVYFSESLYVTRPPQEEGRAYVSHILKGG